MTAIQTFANKVRRFFDQSRIIIDIGEHYGTGAADQNEGRLWQGVGGHLRSLDRLKAGASSNALLGGLNLLIRIVVWDKLVRVGFDLPAGLIFLIRLVSAG